MCKYLIGNWGILLKKLFEDNVWNQEKVYARFKQSCQTRYMKRSEINSPHGIPQVDPLPVQ